MSLCTVAGVAAYVEAIETALRIRAARWLESGSRRAPLLGPLVRGLARIHAPIAARTLRRPVSIPDGLRVVTVGGATLGGSGKSRVALACVEVLAERGLRVALIGHAYRAHPGEPRVVEAKDVLAEVGDEALAAARRFERLGVDARVVVAPSRGAALAYASSLAIDVAVLDGPLQLRPKPASLALLAVDADAPWGSGELFPAGDLRAPQHDLRAFADAIVDVQATPRAFCLANEPNEASEAREARKPSEKVGSDRLRDARIGLFAALARPDRLVRALDSLGLPPVVAVLCPDHGPLTREAESRLRTAEPEVDVWLATEKCAVHLDAVKLERPVAIIDAGCPLPDHVRAHLSELRHVGEASRPRRWP